MSRKTAINTIWSLTLASFVFVQVVGAVVILSVLFFEGETEKYRVIGAYVIFLLCSWLVYSVARYIRNMVKNMYDD